MNSNFPLFALVVTLAAATAQTAEPNPEPNSSLHLIYSAAAAKILTQKSTFVVPVFVENLGLKEEPGGKSENPGHDDDDVGLHFSAKLESRTETFYSTAVQVKPGMSDKMTFTIGAFVERLFNLTVRVTDLATGKVKLEVKKLTSVRASRKPEHVVLVHTDKPIYRPGETVKFRVILLNGDLRPPPPPPSANNHRAGHDLEQVIVEVKILDSQGNLIKLWGDKGVVPENGLFNGQLALSEEPLLGEWTIQVKTVGPKKGNMNHDDDPNYDGDLGQPSPGTTLRTTFLVDRYVLPKFSVQVKVPPFITFDTTKVPVTIEAKYSSSGRRVTGEATVYPMMGRRELWTPILTTIPVGDDSEDDSSGVIRSTAEIDVRQPLFGACCHTQRLDFVASFTEGVTGKQVEAVATTTVYQFPYKIQIFLSRPHFKPGLPYRVSCKVSSQDDIPIHDPSLNALQIRLRVPSSPSSSRLYTSTQIRTSLPKNGTTSHIFDVPPHFNNNSTTEMFLIEAQYKELVVKSPWVRRFISTKSKNMVLVEITSENIQVNTNTKTNTKVRVNVVCTAPFSSVNYIIFGRARILDSGKVVVLSNSSASSSSVQFELRVLPTYRPEVTLLVFLRPDDFPLDDKEMVSDSVKFHVTSTSTLTSTLTSTSLVSGSTSREGGGNFLNISLSEESRRPGQNVTIHLRSDRGSTVALRGVDQSVFLLNKKQDHDITQQSLDKHFVEEQHGNGITILTNGGLEVTDFPPPSPPHPRRPCCRGLIKSSSTVGQKGQNEEEAKIRVRSKFPETWLWQDVFMGNRTLVDLEKMVPDSLTSWIITGYSLNPVSGIAVLDQPKKMTVSRPFFVSLELPYSVVKGEVLNLQVLVHNNIQDSNKDILAHVFLDNSEGKFELLEEEQTLEDPKKATNPKILLCKPNSVTPTTFTIVPKTFGQLLLNVKLMSVTTHVHGHGHGLAGDAVSRHLKVIPPGEKQRGSVSTLLRVNVNVNVNGNASNSNWNKTPIKTILKTRFPAEPRVQGADQVKLTLTGDPLGRTIENLDKLIQLPTGCGEQNMLNFVANIVVLDYLDSVNRLDPQVKGKALLFLEVGYQRQLTFRHPDGSFSAFGPSSSGRGHGQIVVGSTWLTAFVARSFIQAQRFIHVDQTVIEQALVFVAGQQDPDNGGVLEYGQVIHRKMQGGSGSNGVALTAYALLAFQEARKHGSCEKMRNQEEQDDNGRIKKAENFILNNTIRPHVKNKRCSEEQISQGVDNPYALVIATYALHVTNHPQKDLYFKIMNQIRTTTQHGTLMYWQTKPSQTTKPREPSNGSYGNETTRGATTTLFLGEPLPREPTNVAPSSIEMTAYALLVYISRGDVAGVVPIGKWLLQQLSSKGGFLSTQDTVVGLTALAQFAKRTKVPHTDLKIVAKYEGLVKEIKVTDATKVLLQEIILPQSTRSVKLATSGSGAVMVQLSWTYYVETAAVRKPAFGLNISMPKNKESDILRLKVCTWLLKGSTTNMAIVEINLPSGYALDEDAFVEQVKLVPNYRRHDTTNLDSKVEIYLHGIWKSENNTCLELSANRLFNVKKNVQSYVTVYDYYDPKRKAVAFYEPPSESA